MITFPFVKFYSENLGIIKRPLAKVELINSDKKIILPMLIDSGADVSIISYENGLELGLVLEKDEHISDLGGIAGGIPVVYRRIQMQIGDYLFDTKIAWSLGKKIPEILGRIDVFDEFDIELQSS